MGGNPNLEPQKAHTFSFGMEAQPPIVPGLRLNLEYYEVLITHLISIPPLSDQIWSPSYAAYALRNPTLAFVLGQAGSLPVQGPSLASLYANGASPYAFFYFTRENLGAEHQHGLDFDASYRHPVGAVTLLATVGGEYILQRELQSVAGRPFVDALESPGASRLSLSASLGATAARLTAMARLEYTGGYDVDPALITTVFPTPQTHVDAFKTVDLFFGYNLPDSILPGTRLTLNIDNVFNSNPPFYNAGSSYGNGATLGRLFQFGFTKEF